MSFWSELRTRNVFKAGAAYAVVAWLLAQVASIVLPTFNAPPVVMQVFIFFLFVGFPIALLLAWAHELTPDAARVGVMESVPLKRYRTNDEVANVILFLPSDESAYCTGGVFTVDGGFTAA